MRRPKQFSQILTMSVAASLLVIGVIITRALIKTTIAHQTNRPLCFHLQNGESRCYPTPSILSGQSITAMAGQPNGTILASSDRNTIQLWDLRIKQRLSTLKGHSSRITALAISGNGSLLASSDLNGTIKLWQLPSGRLLHTLKTASATALTFNQTGTVLASASRLVQPPRADTSKSSPTFSPYPIHLWDVTTYREISHLDIVEPVNALALSPDAQWLAAGTSSTHVWHLPSQKLVHRLDSGSLNALIFSVDARRLLTGSDGIRGEGGIKVWQVDSGQLVRVIDSVASDFALSQDGNLLITTYGDTANLWQMPSFNYLGTLHGAEYSGLFAEFGLRGNAIALGSSDGVKVWFPQSDTSSRVGAKGERQLIEGKK